MQLAGKQCACCAQVIVAEREGTWCAACRSTFHVACIARRGDECPTCRAPRDEPEQYVVHSHLCTKCLRLYELPVARCTACGTNMSYENADVFDARVQDIDRLAMRSSISGIAMLVGGVAVFLSGIPIGFEATIVIGALLLMFGSRRLWIGGRLGRFR